MPLWLLAGLGMVAALALVPAFWRRARGAPLRALVFLLILLALANPRLVEETRETRPDIALLVIDRSDSARIGNRAPRRSKPPALALKPAPAACRSSRSAPSRCPRAATRVPACSPPWSRRWRRSPAPGWPASSP